MHEFSRDEQVSGAMETTESLFRSAASTLQAKSLAIVGASERARWPSEIFKNLRECDYPGRIVLVNPRQSQVFDQPCLASLRDVGAPIDHALVIVPAAAVPGVLLDAEAAGVKSATVYASMIGDGEDPESLKRGAWLKDFTAASRLRVAGPNCMGAYSYRERLMGYPNAELCRLAPGSVACIFQSGGLIQFWMKAAAERGLRFSYCITSGNEPDLGLADYLNFVIDDPETRQVVLFIEGIRRPAAFMHAAGRALGMGKPILAIKSGATAMSQAASQSHTGAIAGDYAAYLAMCERYGIVNCPSLDDLVETALVFDGGRAPKGPRIGFVTTSGATVDLLYDYAEAEGAAMPDFDVATKAALLPLMQPGIAPRNPLDVGIPSTLEVAADLCAAAAQDPNIDMVAWAAPMPRKSDAWGDVAPLRALLDRTDKPVVAFGRVISQMDELQVSSQKAAGFPFLQGILPTIRALNALWFHAARRGHTPKLPAAPSASRLSASTLDATLAQYGIRVPKSEAVANTAEAVAAAERIGFPVALKIRSDAISHKTEAGGVALDLRTGVEVQSATESLLAKARQAFPGARLQGFLVQEMVTGVEAIVGARTDPFYGPLLLLGTGGILVELTRDVALRLLPVTADDVKAMMSELKLSRLLASYRGQAAADVGALIQTALALGRFFLDHRSAIEDIELNPVMVHRSVSGAVAVDVRVVWRTKQEA
ncbi:MAG TPA: acetate--CoA ligase family protein [Xanthobacteraceae bacterium]|jgi:acetyltransferase